MLTFLLSEDPTVPRPEDALLTKKNTSKILDCSDREVDSKIERGDLESVKDGRYVKIPLSSINRYIERLKSVAREKLEAAADPPPRRGRPRKHPVRVIGEGPKE